MPSMQHCLILYCYILLYFSLGCVLLVVYGAQLLWESTSKYRSVIILMSILLILVGTCKTISRNRDWCSREYLLRLVVPSQSIMHILSFMCMSLFESHTYPKCILKKVNKNEFFHFYSSYNCCRAGLKVLPHNAKMHYNFGNFLRDSSKHETASLHYREALRFATENIEYNIK